MEEVDLMSFEDFKWQLRQAYRGTKYFVTCVLISLLFFGISMAEDSIYPPIIGVLICLIGLYILVRGIHNRRMIKNGTHPLLVAIKNEDRKFIIWIFTVDNYNRHHRDKVIHVLLKMKDRNGKTYSLPIDSNTRTQGLIDYLSSTFNEALIGNDKSTRAKALKKLKEQKKT